LARSAEGIAPPVPSKMSSVFIIFVPLNVTSSY
jgi:hypothetical protein